MLIFPIYLTLVVKISCTAAHFGQLTAKTGLAFEGYDLCLTCGLLWLVVQALAMRASDFEAQYNATDVVLSMSFLLPFIGDGFDSLKDAMLGALALRSQLVPLQFLGRCFPVYTSSVFSCGLGMEWEQQSPTRKGIFASTLLEEAKTKKHYSRGKHTGIRTAKS